MEELEVLLARTSAIELKDFEMEMSGDDWEIDIVARIEVLGRSHTLAIQMVSDGSPEQVRDALKKLHHGIRQLRGNVTPVIVVPCLSDEIRKLCRESNAGFLDLHGNGCLAFGEVFISQRSSCHNLYVPAASERARRAKANRNRLEKFPPAHAEFPSQNFGIVNHAQGH